jgi:recombination DNA repair RAD52 pathway protein
MSFTDKQISALNQPIDKGNVSERWADKRKTLKLAYIESWHVIREANRIFNYDWSSETLKMDLVHADNFCVTYIAKVRVIVNGIVKEGIGAGHGRGERVPAGDKHESAVKEAESDARKRALMQFGDQFGLSLYDKEKNWQKTTPPVNNDLDTSVTPKQTNQKQIESDPIPEALSKYERNDLITNLGKLAKSENEQEIKLFHDLELYCRKNFPIPPEGKFSDYIQEKRHKIIIDDYLRPYKK